MKNPEQTARKRNKAKNPNGGQVVIIESPKGRYSDFAKKAKPKKIKWMVKEISSERPDPKKKQRDSKSKKEICASSPVVIESSSDSELLRDAKKRNKMFKKEKDQKPFCTQFPNSEGVDEGQPGIHFHLSKKGGKSIREVDRQDEESMMKRRKKKKEKQQDKPTSPELLHSRDSEVSVKQISGELKPSWQKMLSNQKKSRTLGQKVVGEKVKKRHLDYYKGDQENSNSISKEDMAQSRDANMQQQEDLGCRSEKDSEATKEEKKLKKISIASLASLARIQENCCNIMSEYSLKCGFKKGVGVCQAPKEVNKAAKKEVKRETGGGSHVAEAGQDILAKVGAPGGKEKRKKAKKHKVEGDCVLRGDRDGLEGSQEQIKKKKKNKQIKNSHDSKKKAKKKKETKVHLEWRRPMKQEAEDEVKLVAFRQGNCDEVKIDKVRRQELQEEIDRESGKIKTAKEELDSRLGQWSTAAFETPEQKTKFHRLLGGLKNSSAPAQRFPANANQSNMALDRPIEQVLQQNLETEFKKAVEFKHHRGIGLGFRSGAPSGVHIDKYASKSIKFEG